MTVQMLDLENKWFYRLVKVMYIFFLAVGLIGVICMGWGLKPYQLVDIKKSYLTCPDGTKHSFDSLGLYFYTKSNFSDDDSKKAIIECNKHLKTGSEPALIEFAAPDMVVKLVKSGNGLRLVTDDFYATHWAYKTRGLWIEAIEMWCLGSLVIFLIINGIKQSLLYVVYGKKFTFNWEKET